MSVYILCIDTSTDICSVGVFGDMKLLAIKETTRSFSHSEVISIFIKEVLEEASIKVEDLSAIAIAGGPGSYTALRIGTATAKGLCYGLDIPLIALSTLDILVEAIQDKVAQNELIIPLLDARRNEVYHAIYDSDGNQIEKTTPYILHDQSYQYLSAFSSIHFVGDGVMKAKEILSITNGVFHQELNSARWMGDLAFQKWKERNFENINDYEPFYYKSPNITTSKKKLL